MVVFCEECGIKYRIDSSKIKGEDAKGRCQSCGHLITISKQEVKSSELSFQPPDEESFTEVTEKRPSTTKLEDAGKTAGMDMPNMTGRKQRRFGLTSKFMFSILTPLLIIYSLSVYFSVKNLISMHWLTIDRSSNILKKMTEEKMESYSRLLAMKVSNYLMSHPGLKKENFNNDEDFKKVALHKVGRTGYTVLFEMPDKDGIWRAWIHTNPDLIGIDLGELSKPLGKNFPGLWKALTGVKGGKESTGYYKWQDKDGRIRDKYLISVPVEGTPYVIGATLYLDELYRPVKKLEKETQQMAQKTIRANIVIMGAGLLAIAIIIFFYGRNFTRKIKHLSETAERISIGELNAELEIKSKDEIGDLANAISRMQDSIRLSIERLRGRRKKIAA